MPASDTTLQAPPAGRYVVDPSASSVAFTTRHMFGLGRVRGRFAVTRGAVTVAEPPEDSHAEAEISAASFTTRNVLRDGHVRSRLILHTRRHPAFSFRSTGVERREGSWTVTGVLTVKGRSAPVELAATDVVVEGTEVVFRATGTIDRYAHGVTAARGMVARHLAVDITARTARRPS